MNQGEAVSHVCHMRLRDSAEAHDETKYPWTVTLRHDLPTSSELLGAGRKRGLAARANARPCAVERAVACTAD
jgi:hypothetical protein